MNTNRQAHRSAVASAGAGRGSRPVVRFLSLLLLFAGAQAPLPAAEAVAPDLAGIVAADTAVEKVLDGFKDVRGPAFSRVGYLVFSDAPNNKILKYTPAGSNAGLVVLREDSKGALGLNFDRQGRLLVCEAETRRVVRAERSGAITVLADKFNGKQFNRPTDVVWAIDSSAYFTDLATVYLITRSGEVRAAAIDFKASAGLALSGDQRTLYVSDSATNQIRVFEIKGAGELVNGRVFAVLDSPGKGSAGGLRTDNDGNVYCAGPGGVWVFNKAGRHLGTIAVPEAPSSVAWGENYKTLYIAAETSLYRIRLKPTGTQIY